MVGVLRTRMHNHMDDLRSYKQAVLAPRRRGKTTPTGPLRHICHLLWLPLPLRRLRVIGPAPQEAVAVVTGV
jgi:hypothetical protein